MIGLITIAGREMRLLSRTRYLHIQRVLVIALPLFLFFLDLFNSDLDLQNLDGLDLLIQITLVSSFIAWCLGAMSVADSISVEKRDGTIGLLMMTNLGPIEILLGKWLSSSLSYTVNILSLIPLFYIISLSGGITPIDIILCILVIYINFILSSCIGLAISAIMTESRLAYMATLSAILLGFLIQVFFSSVIPIDVEWGTIPKPVAFTPQTLGLYIQPGKFIDSPLGRVSNGMALVIQAVLWMMVSIGFLILAGMALNHFWRAQKELTRSVTKRKKWILEKLDLASIPLHHLVFRSDEKKQTDVRKAMPDPIRNRNPIEWFWLRNTKLPHWQLVVLGVFEAVFMTAIIAVIYLVFDRYSISGELGKLTVVLIVIAIIFDLFFKFSASLEVCRKIIEDRNNSGFELINTTPIPEKDIISGMTQALNHLIRRYKYTSTVFYCTICTLATINLVGPGFDTLDSAIVHVSFLLIISGLLDWNDLVKSGISIALKNRSLLNASLKVFMVSTIIPFVSLMLGMFILGIIVAKQNQIDWRTLDQLDAILVVWILLKLAYFHIPAYSNFRKLASFRREFEYASVKVFKPIKSD